MSSDSGSSDDFSSSSSDVSPADTNAPLFSDSDDRPKNIKLNSVVQEVDFHPFKDIIAAGSMNGYVKIYSYTADKDRSNHKLMSFSYHKQCCRCVKFSARGDFLFTASTDKKIFAIDLNEGTLTRHMTHKESDAIYSLLSIDNYLLASGDDNGMVVIWDFRREMPLMSVKCCQDYVSKLTMPSDKRTLLASCGEGSLSVYNIRARKLEAQSELQNHDMMSVAISDNETKVVTALDNGALKIFNWGEWTNASDKFVCYNGSIDDILSVDNKILCAGCEDGNIRFVHINPHKVVGVLRTSELLPVYNMSISHDKKYIASCAYEKYIKFHTLPPLSELKKNLENKNEESFNEKPKSSFFSGLDET